MGAKRIQTSPVIFWQTCYNANDRITELARTDAFLTRVLLSEMTAASDMRHESRLGTNMKDIHAFLHLSV